MLFQQQSNSAPPSGVSSKWTPPSTVVTVCGGGNLATVCAGYLGAKPSLAVNILTRRPERWSSVVTVKTDQSSWADRGTFEGRVNKISSDPKEVIPESDLVILAAPGHAQPHILNSIAKHVRPGTIVGSIFCQGGFEWAARKAFGESLGELELLFGLFNVPWIAYASQPGKVASIFGPKKRLFVATFPVEKARAAARLVALLFDVPASVVPNFLTLTLTPSNQIIHPARYYGIFHNWDGKRGLREDEIQWNLYKDMDDLSATWLQKLDDELQSIRVALQLKFPALDLTMLMPLAKRIVFQYGDDIADKSSLKSIFRTNLGYANCKTPTQPAPTSDGGYWPALKSRLFWEDIPYGLCILKSIAQMLQLPTPSIDFMIRWHQQYMNKKFLLDSGELNKELIDETAAPEAYGITSLEALVASSIPQQHGDQVARL